MQSSKNLTFCYSKAQKQSKKEMALPSPSSAQPTQQWEGGKTNTKLRKCHRSGGIQLKCNIIKFLSLNYALRLLRVNLLSLPLGASFYSSFVFFFLLEVRLVRLMVASVARFCASLASCQWAAYEAGSGVRHFARLVDSR